MSSRRPTARPRLDNQNARVPRPRRGTRAFITSVLAQRAPDATIRQYRAVDSFGFSSTWRPGTAPLRAVADGAQVVNVSLGFEDPDLFGPPHLGGLHTIPSSILVVASAELGDSGSHASASHRATIPGSAAWKAASDPVSVVQFRSVGRLLPPS